MSEVTKSCEKYFVSLSQSEINVIEAIDFVRSEKCGAIQMFLGTTRNTDKLENSETASPIKSLFYECYEKMAISEMEIIVKSELANFTEVHKCYVKHRLGCVQAGHASIVIAASSIHRKAAQTIVTNILDRIKQTVPIWKKIHFEYNDEEIWSKNSEAFWLRK